MIFKNRIAAKLTLYFTICLLVFSLVVGLIFMWLFRSHTIQLHKDEMERRSISIATTMSGLMGSSNHGSNHSGGYGAYLRFLEDITMTDVWIIDSNYQILTFGHGMHQPLEYKDLPPEADMVIAQVFGGKTAFFENLSSIWGTPTLTVGTPIMDGQNVLGVVLLHSPIGGTNAAVLQGFKALGISMAAALLIAGLLSIFLSKSFTDPIINKEAEEALRLEKLRRDFVANISHELKTPIAVVRGSLEAIVDRVVTEPAQVEQYHHQMLSETLFLQRLVGDLLDLSRLQNTDFTIEMQDISLDDLVDDAVRSASQIARNKGVSIQLHKNADNLTLNGDYGRLRQMLLIVLDNAVKFSPPRGEINVAFERKDLTISDNGSGIDPQELPYIFDRFYKSGDQQNRSGTGLGLAIAKQIAGRHGITITAVNRPDGGATFRFTLP